MTDDPCDEWPVAVVNNRMYVVRTWCDRFAIAVAGIGEAAAKMGEAFRTTKFDEPMPLLSEVLVREKHMQNEKLHYYHERVVLENRKAKGYRAFEYGGKRWGKPGSQRWKDKR